MIPFLVSATIFAIPNPRSNARSKNQRGDEEREQKEGTPIRSAIIGMLLSGIVLLVGSSCATVPKEPLAPGEIRLLSMEVLGTGIKEGAAFPVNVFFEGEGRVEIKRACFYESEERQYCSKVSYVTWGTKRAFQVYLPSTKSGSYKVECYAEYVRNGEIQRTNVIATQISIGP